MADNLKFLEREILNKVLNAGEDALNVDLTAGGSAMLVDDAAFTPGTSTVQMVGAEFDDTGPDSVDEGDAGAIRMSANRNLYTTIRDAAGNERGVNVNSSSQLLVDGSGVTQPVSGTVSVSGLLADGHAVTIDNASDDEVYVRGSGSAGSADAGVITVQGIGSGTALAVTESSPISGFATSANQLADGHNVTVDNSSIEVVGDAVEDEAVAGNPVLSGGRHDASVRNLDDGDVGALALDPSGALYVREYLGQAGSILVTGTTNAVTTSVANTKFIAIQFLEDTTFDAGAEGLVASTAGLWPDDNDASTTIDANGGAVTGSEVFPQGMTIFGRWDGFKLDSGKVIGYLGYV